MSVGSVVATGMWLLASLGFSRYVDTFGRYSRTYGVLASVAILMLWERKLTRARNAWA